MNELSDDQKLVGVTQNPDGSCSWNGRYYAAPEFAPLGDNWYPNPFDAIDPTGRS